jgi:hypothetical protein
MKIHIDYIKNYLNLHIQSLNQDLEQLSNQMEALDPASKDFQDLDFEYNYTTGQVNACLHIMGVIAEREDSGITE